MQHLRSAWCDAFSLEALRWRRSIESARPHLARRLSSKDSHMLPGRRFRRASHLIVSRRVSRERSIHPTFSIQEFWVRFLERTSRSHRRISISG